MASESAEGQTGREAPRRPRWKRWALDGLLFVALAAGVMAWQTRHLPEAGTPLPQGTLYTLEGQAVRLQDYQGRPLALEVWAPWCGVCALQASTLSTLQRTVGERARVVAVATGYRSEEEVRAFVARHEVDYPVLLGDDTLLEALSVDSFPTLLFVSPEGRITRSAVGYTSLPGLLWRLWL